MNEIVAVVLGIVGAILTVISVTIGILTFYYGRKRQSTDDGEFRGSLKTDIDYIKKGVDELRDDNRDMREDYSKLEHRVTLVEASAKSAHKRIDVMNKIPERA